MRQLTLLCLLCSLAAMIFSGCAGYQLGPSNGKVAQSQSIQVNPFKNDTIEPRLTDYVSNALRKRLQQDGTYKLDTQGDGDIIVNGVITTFFRSELGFDPNDTRTVRDYYVFITADVTATERGTGKVLLHRPINGRTVIRVGNDMASAERQAIPVMADDLARKAVSALTDGTW